MDIVNRPTTNDKFPAHHHTSRDAMAVIDADALKQVARWCLL